MNYNYRLSLIKNMEEQTWIKNVVSTTMFGITGAYFVANLDAKTFLDTTTAHLTNSFGAALSFMCLLMTFFYSLAQTDLFKGKMSTDFESLWAGMEQKVRDTSLLILFSLVAIGSGMKTSDTLSVLAMTSIFVGRQTAKYFDMQEILKDSRGLAGSKGSSVTWVQNGMACIMFVTASVTELIEVESVDIIDILLGIAGVTQLVLLVSKRFNQTPNTSRMIFEETVGSLFHFVVLGSLLSRVTKSTQLISVAAVIIADFSSKTQVLDATEFSDKVGSTMDSATKLLITRVVLLATSATAALCSVLLFDKAAAGKESSLYTFAMVAGVLKSLNSIAFLLDSRTVSYKSVYNFISNGCTSLLLATSSILLGMDKSDPKALTVLLFCAAAASRVVDMVQNAYASPKTEESMYTSSIENAIVIDSARLDNFRAIVVFVLLVSSATASFIGLGDLCPDFITAKVDTAVAACKEQDDVNIMLSYFSMLTVHTILGVVAFVVAATEAPRYIALSTVEIPRVLVSSSIIILGGLIIGVDENTILTMSFVLYLLADGLGMSLM